MRSFRAKLLNWYRSNKRDLPWRRTKDPYSIWVSEVMLQQTRVDTVIPYYQRFLQAYPSIRDLATADPESVLKSWEGLGYYSRARNMMAAAQEVVADYAGKLPNQSSKLRTLKGFGPYTSAAVASIAFNEPIACVDGNVKRVISRIFASDKLIEKKAQDLIDKTDPANFNQAMMELGALVCLPRSPRCLICPVAKHCKALKDKEIERYPAKKARLEPKPIYAASVVISDRNKVLLIRRKTGGRYGGFYEFPTFENSSRSYSEREIKEILKRDWGVLVQKLKRRHSFNHYLTHRTYKVKTFEAQISKNPGSGLWVDQKKLSQVPLSKLQQRVWKE